MDIIAEKPAMTPAAKTALLILNSVLLAIGNCGGPQMARLYFNNGGQRIWFSSWLQTAAWPITFIPLLFSYIHRRRNTTAAKSAFILIKPPLFLAAAVIGALSGFGNYLYAYGLKYLPVSTASLIVATQLGFTAVFAYFMVKQKFTAYSINAIVLLTFGAGILALHTNGDRPAGESRRQYAMGFVMMIATSVLYGLILPLMELSYKKGKQEIGYTVVLEFQMVMSFFATAVTTVGMLADNDFKVQWQNHVAWEGLSRMMIGLTKKKDNISWTRKVAFNAVLYHVWKERNTRIFEGKSQTIRDLSKRLCAFMKENIIAAALHEEDLNSYVINEWENPDPP